MQARHWPRLRRFPMVAFSDTGMDLSEYEVDELNLDLVAPLGNTLQDDLLIRLTDDAVSFLAKVLKINLVGLVPASKYSVLNTKNTLFSALNDTLIAAE